jgi:hypothetical protein
LLTHLVGHTQGLFPEGWTFLSVAHENQ